MPVIVTLFYKRESRIVKLYPFPTALSAPPGEDLQAVGEEVQPCSSRMRLSHLFSDQD